MPRRPSFLPLNLYLDLDDGRHLIIRGGSGQFMRCRQKAEGAAAPIKVGETVRTIPGRDGRKAVLEVVKRTKKDVFFEILGSEGEPVPKGGCDRCGTDGQGNVVALCERHR